MKLFKNLLLCATIACTGLVASAQEVTLPTDPKPEGFDFVHRTLILHYTGTTCSSCHPLIYAKDIIKEDATYGSQAFWAAYHGYSAEDPMYYKTAEMSDFNPDSRKGYPSVRVGFSEVPPHTNMNSYVSNLKECLDTCMDRELMAGLAVNSKVEGNTLTVKAELKAVKEGNFTIGCWLVEDNIDETQLMEKGKVIEMTHMDVIRFTASVYGNEVGTVKAGEKANTSFSINLHEAWKQKNCRLLIYACVYQEYTDIWGKTGEDYIIANVISAPLNKAVPYEYIVPGAIEGIEATNEIQIAYLAGDQVEVTAASPLKDVTVYNLQGEVVLQISPATESTTLSLGTLSAGAYIVRADDGKSQKTQKIIKR